MKSAHHLTTLFLIAGIVLYAACKKEYSCENCRELNNPPVANAGKDTILILPQNEVLLDGSQSYDPDDNIATYQWRMISGPASYKLTNANAVQTQLLELVEGSYRFELTVTDSTRLSDKDSIEVVVRTDTTTGAVVDSTRLKCDITITQAATLPTPGPVFFSATAGSKILFCRPNNASVDMYDTITRSWETKTGLYALNHYLPEQIEVKLARVGTKLIFSGPVDILDKSKGQVVNMYDFILNQWTTTQLAQARSFYAMAVVGNKVYYADGNNDSKKMDVYDASTNTWSALDFTNERLGMTALSFGNKIFFAGGLDVRKDSLVLQCDDFGNNCNWYPALVASKRVDILDVSTNTWSVEYLSEARAGVAATIVGNTLVFAGGENSQNISSSVVDMYNTSTHTWSSHNLGPGNGIVSDYNVFSIKDKLLIPIALSNKIYVYDNTNNTWSLALMPYSYAGDMLDRGKVASVGNKMIFIQQYFDRNNSHNGGIDIYDASSNTWCHSELTLGYALGRSGIVQTGNRILIAGGLTMTGCCGNNGVTDKVFELKF